MPNNQNKPISGFTSLNVATGNELILAMLTGTTVNLTLDTAKDYIISEMPDGAPITGGTYSNGSVLFTNSTGGTFSVTGFTLDNYSLSDLGFSITSLSGATIDRDITLPEYSYITYQSPLVVDGGYTLTVPPSSEFDIVTNRLDVTTTTTNNISDAIYTVNKGLSANGSTTATTSVCSYGVNVFEYVTLSNIATKLPQPVTGKSVKIVNLGSTLLKVYPSNLGGRINNLPINEPAILPPDGKLYEFICIENPLPGAWTFSTPATGQYDSGEISMSVDLANKPVVTAINSQIYASQNSYFSATVNYNSKNLPPQILPENFIVGGYDPDGYGVWFRPEIPWECISKVKVYTNLIQAYDEYGDEISMGGETRILACGRYEYYDPEDTSSPIGSGGAISTQLIRVYADKTISGAPTTGSTIYTSANIGDPGTLWGEFIKAERTTGYYPNTDAGSIGATGEYEGTFIGNKSLGIVPYPFPGTFPVPQFTPVEYYYSSYISFQMDVLPYLDTTDIIPDLKFRFVIEYY